MPPSETIRQVIREAENAFASTDHFAGESSSPTGPEIFQMILESIPIDFVVFDTQHRFIFIGEHTIKDPILRKNLIGRTELDYFLERGKPLDIAHKRRSTFEQALQEKQNVAYEEVLQNNGKNAYKLRAFHPILNLDGEVSVIVGYGYDITQVRESEAVIRRQSLAIESAMDGIGVLDAEGRYVYLNKAHLDFFGYSSAELIGRTWHTLYGTEEIQRIETELFPLLQKNGRWTGETIGVSKTGKPVHQEITLTPLPDGGLICICRDIDERKKQERELKKLALVVEQTKSIVIINDKHNRVEWVNHAFTNLTGYQLDEVAGQDCLDLVKGPGTCEKTHAYLKWQMLQGLDFDCEIMHYHKNGSPYWVHVHGEAFKNEHGEKDRIFCIQEDITANKQINQDLLLAKEAAEASARSKRRFLANMSHEIRTPMNAVLGFTELLLKTKLNGEQEEFAKTIQASAGNLLNIINDILDISKLEEGKVQLEALDFNLSEALERSIAVLLLKAEEKGVGLRHHCRLQQPNVSGDPYRLNQVLLNVIGNAVKFTERGYVEVECYDAKDSLGCSQYHIIVKDTGIGMEPAMVENVFAEFRQGDESFVRKYGGTGLGLSISRSLLGLMGGTISIKSQLGAGTTVHLTIPFLPPMNNVNQPEKKTTPANTRFEGKSVLLVEDNHLNCVVASMMLKNAGLSVTLAVNGQAACTCMETQSFDLVLMDIQMPVMDGVEATRWIRQHLQQPVPIIALTAHALREEREIYLQVGMNDFLTKPFKEGELISILSKWIPYP